MKLRDSLPIELLKYPRFCHAMVNRTNVKVVSSVAASSFTAIVPATVF